jgi:hypothetical protein
MARMIPPQGLKEVSVKTERGTKVYRAGRDGLINVDNPRHAKQMKAEGLGEASTSGIIVGQGFPCSQCGFGSWFKKCSRCGHDNERIERDGSIG